LAWSGNNMVASALWSFGLVLTLSGCGLLPGIKPPEPPTGQSAAQKDPADGSPSRSAGSGVGGGPPGNPAPGTSPLQQQTPIPSQVAAPVIGSTQPQVECTFRLACIASGNDGASFSGTCLNRRINTSVQAVKVNNDPVFPQCERVKPIFADPLPTGKHTTTLEGGATLKAYCDGATFVLQNGGFELRMSLPQATCLELRDRINALKL
jgi:hypothetical protein